MDDTKVPFACEIDVEIESASQEEADQLADDLAKLMQRSDYRVTSVAVAVVHKKVSA